MKRQLRDILEEYESHIALTAKIYLIWKSLKYFIVVFGGILLVFWVAPLIFYEMYEYEILLIQILILWWFVSLIWYLGTLVVPIVLEKKHAELIEEMKLIFVERLKERYDKFILNHLIDKNVSYIGELEVYVDNQSISIVAPWSMVYSDLTILPFEIEWLYDFDLFSLLELYINRIDFNQVLSVKQVKTARDLRLSQYDSDRMMLNTNLEVSAIRVEGNNIALGIANDMLALGSVLATEIKFKEDKSIKKLYLPIEFYPYLSDTLRLEL
jgi:hypothetical protein